MSGFVEPLAPRYEIDFDEKGTRVQWRCKRNWLVLLFLSLWLLGWTLGEVFAASALVIGLYELLIGQLLFDGHLIVVGLFLTFWLIFWTTGGVAAINAWLWEVRGVEVIKIDREALAVEKRPALFGTAKKYRIENVRHLRARAQPGIPWQPWVWWGQYGGGVAFDYGARTVIFGTEMDEAEAKQLVGELHKMYPGLA